jgi:hypothetical protein
MPPCSCPPISFFNAGSLGAGSAATASAIHAGTAVMHNATSVICCFLLVVPQAKDLALGKFSFAPLFCPIPNPMAQLFGWINVIDF